MRRIGGCEQASRARARREGHGRRRDDGFFSVGGAGGGGSRCVSGRVSGMIGGDVGPVDMMLSRTWRTDIGRGFQVAREEC